MKINRRDVLRGGVGLGLFTIAGCSSDGSDQSPSASDSETTGTSSPAASEANTTDTPTATASIESVAFPSGWSAEGLQNIEQARNQHKSSTENTSFRQTGVVDTNQVYNGRADTTVEYDSNNLRLLVNIDVDYRGEDRSGIARTDVYVDEEHLYKRMMEADADQFSYSQSDPDYSQAYRGANENLIEILTIFDLTAQEANAVQGGVEIVYGVAGLSPEGQETRYTEDIYGDRQGESITITESGRVASYDLNVGAKDETEAWFEQSIDHSSIGDVSVSRPDWIGNV